jgi:ketosteroid isomerase-like protein
MERAMAHPNADLMRKATEALNAGDVQTFLDLHTDDVVLHVTGRNEFSGTVKGKGELASLFERQMKVLDGPPQFELHDVLGSDDHGIVLGIQRASRGGKTLESKGAVIAHTRGGKFSEIWVLAEDPYAEDEFFA